MSLERLKQHIREIVDIENDELNQIISVFKLVKYPPKKIILKKGQECNFIAYINKGCLVYYTKFDERERVINFPRENWWIGDLDNFLSHSPANIYLKTLEETELLTLDYTGFMNLIQNHPNFLRFHLINTHRSYMQIDERFAKITSLSAEDKYNLILKDSPGIINRVPSKYLASFLGIEPPSLSRIRRNMSKKIMISDE